MSRLPPESIREFQRLYEAEFGVRLPDAEAEEAARELLEFYALISGRGKSP
jgi:hypothetical protein